MQGFTVSANQDHDGAGGKNPPAGLKRSSGHRKGIALLKQLPDDLDRWIPFPWDEVGIGSLVTDNAARDSHW